MKKKPASKSAFFNTRVSIGFSFCLLGLVLALMAFNASPGGNAFAQQDQPAVAQQSIAQGEDQSESARSIADNSLVTDDTPLAVQLPTQAVDRGNLEQPNQTNVTVAGSTGADGGYATLGAAFTALNANGTQAGNNITVTIAAIRTKPRFLRS